MKLKIKISGGETIEVDDAIRVEFVEPGDVSFVVTHPYGEWNNGWYTIRTGREMTLSPEASNAVRILTS